ncbi:MgtC/SapB family protein [Anianabacter salinae]|uniref:MgtC/SapB family protein n=1 Tax=Anianabacter salinae TaxID=2851023 RepID=UPI00225E3138|nr:MgtC/SapB family protein [Anianabacter salinae]MBV0913990.1 MgtC/SapB family protein [Anianabacter salinae]
MADLLADFSAPFPGLAWQTALARLICAIVLGGLVGWEREVHDKPAGMRTHMLIALASCLFTLLAFDLIAIETSRDDALRVDPLRLIEAVTAGVAFLAAGSILTRQGSVQGLTTGAGMWMAGALGLACGLGRIVLALIAVGLALVVLWLLRRVYPHQD